MLWGRLQQLEIPYLGHGWKESVGLKAHGMGAWHQKQAFLAFVKFSCNHCLLLGTVLLVLPNQFLPVSILIS